MENTLNYTRNLLYTRGKKVVATLNEVAFWQLFIFYLLVRSKGRLGVMAFLCIICLILFNVYFGEFVMTCIDIGEIGCKGIPKCLWMVIVVHLVKQTWFFLKTQPVRVVLCMPGQYWVFQPLALIIGAMHHACLLQGIESVLQGFLPIYPSGFGRAHQDPGAGCPYWWLHGPIHLKYVLWCCSPVILQAAPSWWRCLAEGNQGLPEHGEAWHYCLVSSSYPQYAKVFYKMSL